MIARLTAAAYGMVCYIAGMAALGYTALWLIDLVPNALDAPRSIGIVEALFIDLLLIGLFVAQHRRCQQQEFGAQLLPLRLEITHGYGHIAAGFEAGAVFGSDPDNGIRTGRLMGANRDHVPVVDQLRVAGK